MRIPGTRSAAAHRGTDARGTADAAVPSPRRGPRRRSLTSDAAALAGGSILTQAAQILSLSVLARFVAKVDLATYQQLNLVYGIMAPLLLAGVPAALLYFVPRSQDAATRREWVRRAYVITGCCGVGTAFVVVLGRSALAELFNNPALAPALLRYAPTVLFLFVTAVAPPALVVAGRALSAGVVNAAIGLSLMACLVGAVLVDPTANGLAVALSVASGVTSVASVVLVVRATGVGIRRTAGAEGTMAEMLTYGLPLALTGLAGTLGFQFDRVVVGRSFSPEDFAVYALGAVEIPIGILVATAVGNVLAPVITTRYQAGETTELLGSWRRALHRLSMVQFSLFVLLMLVSSDVVRVLFGPGFERSVAVFRIYLVLIPMRIAVWGLIPQAAGRTDINLRASLLILVVNAVVVLSLVGEYGLVGAALAGPAATLAAVVYYVVRTSRLLEVGVASLLPVRELLVTAAVAAAAGVPVLAVRAVDLPAALAILAATAAYVPAFLVGLRLTRLLTSADVLAARRLLTRGRRSEDPRAPVPGSGASPSADG